MLLTALSLLVATQSQAGPLTRAESTNYQETSTYADVVKFLDDLKASGAPITISSSGTSTEGRKIPLVIAARPMVKNAAEAARSGKLIVYIQANIHAGEVEGKEAALNLLRKYCREKGGILDKAILLVQPIYNADGNEKFGPQARNRPGQNGPESVGVRPNGQNFDLNRDCMKAESPEMAGVLKNIYTWNPHAVFDLHTTDGTRHGYRLTYSGPLNPNTYPSIQKYSFNEFFPEIRKTLSAKHGLNTFDYGNGEFQDGKWRFETFGGEPRYVTNYAGMRNAIPILSEAMVYEPFENRVKDTENFVDECMKKLVKDSTRIKAMKQKADNDIVRWGNNPTNAPLLATRYKLKSRGDEQVVFEKNLAAGGRRSGPVRDVEVLTMPVLDRFEGTRFEHLPYAYILPTDAKKSVELLKLHGVRVTPLREGQQLNVDEFVITNFTQARSAFQGHKAITLEGIWRPTTKKVSGYLVRTGQPLGLLAFELLEPSAIDGLTTWGYLGESFPLQSNHPVLRVSLPTQVKITRN